MVEFLSDKIDLNCQEDGGVSEWDYVWFHIGCSGRIVIYLLYQEDPKLEAVYTTTVILRLNAVATISFTVRFTASTIRGRKLFKGSIY